MWSALELRQDANIKTYNSAREMNRFCVRATSIAAKSCRGVRAATSVPYHHDSESNAPLIQHFRSAWPDAIKDVPAEYQTELPTRTVPDEKLRFNFTTSFDQGTAFFHQHLEGNPADFKVKMTVTYYGNSVYRMLAYG